jgi:hypothetical protein
MKKDVSKKITITLSPTKDVKIRVNVMVLDTVMRDPVKALLVLNLLRKANKKTKCMKCA